MANVNICTLFEGHYSYGLGTLVNSLYSCEFNCTLWVGYRGGLPGWLEQFQADKASSTYIVTETIKLVFLKLDTPNHFTMYKPDFMLTLLDLYCPNAKELIYFDPDILVKAKWQYFENWVNHGVAMCEDVNSPLSMTSPLRCNWRNYFSKHGIALFPKDDIYVNGGFIGVSTGNFQFLEEWKRIQDLIRPDLPSMSELHTIDRSHLFNKLDQDALNITKDLTVLPVSVANKESMDFSPGGAVMSHAIGRPKPWEKNFIKILLETGNRPSPTDKLYFKFVQYPIDIYRNHRIRHALKYVNLKTASIFSRFIAN